MLRYSWPPSVQDKDDTLYFDPVTNTHFNQSIKGTQIKIPVSMDKSTVYVQLIVCYFQMILNLGFAGSNNVRI